MKKEESLTSNVKISKLLDFSLYPKNTDELTGNASEIEKLQKLIFNLYEYKGKIINKNKNVGRLGIEMSSQEMTNLEIIYSYFINLLIENGENQKFLSIDIMNKKYLKKENLTVGIDSIINNEYFINMDNLNNSVIIEKLKNNGLEKLLQDLLQNIESEKAIKSSYKFSINLLKQNTKDVKLFKQRKEELHKSYNNSLTKNTYNYTKICNRIIDIINKNYELQCMSSEIEKPNDIDRINKNKRIMRRLYKSRGLNIYNNNQKYNTKKYKKKQEKISILTKYNKNINLDFENIYIENKDGQIQVVKK